MVVVWLFLAVPWVCLQFVIVVFPDYTHLLFFFASNLQLAPYISFSVDLYFPQFAALIILCLMNGLGMVITKLILFITNCALK